MFHKAEFKVVKNTIEKDWDARITENMFPSHIRMHEHVLFSFRSFLQLKKSRSTQISSKFQLWNKLLCLLFVYLYEAEVIIIMLLKFLFLSQHHPKNFFLDVIFKKNKSSSVVQNNTNKK